MPAEGSAGRGQRSRASNLAPPLAAPDEPAQFQGGATRFYESYADRQIREAIERGEFEDLPGAGEPLRDPGVYDPAWWARSFVTRERVRARADEVRRLLREELPRLRASRDRAAAEAHLAELNRMVDAVNETLPEPERIPPASL